MNNIITKARVFCIRATSVVMFAMIAMGVWAQDTTTTTVREGSPSFDTQVKNAEVVYVEGNDLVLKLEGGKVEHLVVPDTDTFTIDGKEVSVRDLTPGTKLTQTITTTTAPRYVNTVRTLKGRVWHVNPHGSFVILTLPEGGNQTYTFPKNAKFTVHGRPSTVHNLSKGMLIETTIVTDDVHTVVEQSKATVGQAPLPALPKEVGLLLFFHPTIRPIPPPVIVASAEPIVATLPKTGTLLPLAGLLGALGVAMSLGLGATRRVFVKA